MESGYQAARLALMNAPNNALQRDASVAAEAPLLRAPVRGRWAHLR